ncbi:hypothetical protein Bhyg_07277 [Pseudolycoriella hygida]|uniref:Uncharacterized protein n=1 Tax=Pseudolycoriella hygida TaxID=35572 RepID=A0A9Q0S3T5_9DIPT|nr:hypothetical protein Bhyg_07277 [Pseudolycoriella hygida]
MEDMLAKLNYVVDENIGYLKVISTHTDVSIRQSFGRSVLRALQQPIDRLEADVCTLVSTLLIISEDEGISKSFAHARETWSWDIAVDLIKSIP